MLLISGRGTSGVGTFGEQEKIGVSGWWTA